MRTSARVEKLFEGTRWAEGPAYFAAGRYLVWSDIPNDRILRWDEPTGHVGVFRAPAGYTNGHTVDREGRLVSCSHGARRVERTEHDGSITTIADCYDGKRLNSPNDVVVGSDGAVWFSDPTYGIDSDYEGHAAESEVGASHVYRVDPRTGAACLIVSGFPTSSSVRIAPESGPFADHDRGTIDFYITRFTGQIMRVRYRP